MNYIYMQRECVAVSLNSAQTNWLPLDCYSFCLVFLEVSSSNSFSLVTELNGNILLAGRERQRH